MAIVEMLPGLLYAGGKLDSEGWHLVERKVTAVLNVRTKQDAPPFDPSNRLLLLYAPMKNDEPPKLSYFVSVLQMLHALIHSGMVVYVHDTAGINRLGAVLTAFYMQRFGVSAAEALRMVQSKKPNLKPNSRYRALLQEYERVLQRG